MKDIQILFEDEDLIAVSKPIGLVVDVGAERTTQNARDLISVLAERGKKVFPYHRLDRDTSGIVLLGKTRRIARDVTLLFEEKRIRKSYLAVVRGEWPKSLNKVEADLHGKSAMTTFRVLAASQPSADQANEGSSARTWLEALPKTGRKHQIRIHCANSGHPILGDALYGPLASAENASLNPNSNEPLAGHALHAYKLQFRHPHTKTDVVILDAPEAWRETWLSGLEFESAWQRLFAGVTK